MRHAPAVVFVLGLIACILGPAIATDWQTLSTQGGAEGLYFYTANGALVTDTDGAEFRAYVLGADTSDAANQFDGVFSSSTNAWEFDTPRDTWAEIYRIDGTDVLYKAKIFLHGGKGGKGAVDDTTISAGAVTTAALADSSVTQAKLSQGAVGEVQLEASSVTETKIAAASVSAAKMASGQKFHTIAGADSAELAFAEILELMAYTGGNGYMRGSWIVDGPGGVFRFETGGPQLEVADSASFEAGVRIGTNGADLLTVESNTYLKGDVLFGSSRADSFSFRGPAHFDDVRLLDASSVVCDSIGSGDVDKWVLVTGVSDLQTDGYTVHCRASPNFTYWGAYNTFGGTAWKQMLAASPIRQGTTPVASDSVYVIIATSPGLVYIPFCVECFGVK